MKPYLFLYTVNSIPLIFGALSLFRNFQRRKNYPSKIGIWLNRVCCIILIVSAFHLFWNVPEYLENNPYPVSAKAETVNGDDDARRG